MNFSLASYENLLSIIYNDSRSIISFEDYINGNSGIIMRHDIDFCPMKANQIAILENKYNIQSTYFVLVNSELYNFKDYENLNALKNIISLGHKIALHFDSSKYKNEKIILDKVCREECNILESSINYEINMISFHRPEKKFIGMKDKIGDRYHTYMPLFINEMKYCSDSGGIWKFDDPINLINNKNEKNIHLLTHPIWWTTPGELSSGEKIDFHLKGSNEETKNIAAKNCKPYKEYLEKKN